ncbi:hypothetical protein [Myroides odoratimimus]|uniref:hypothetical protein n=1 Tax=Myroides odoratimimus TaxID=76832 RepID=UPI000920D18A|nr:hypothetical protein [Myroides odoratimimus]SHL61514.1 hypothetical protein SAMN05444275_105186 [Myroides odoratimimus subsp. xuanwuensis]
MDKHYESLTKLYLRLKGYVVTNLILHSEIDGNSKSELDVVAIRMPHHLQEYRQVNVPDYLECSNSRIEILIGDVKNYTNLNAIEFNKGLRRSKNSIKQLIEWLGVYERITENEIEKFEFYLNLHRNKKLKKFAEFEEDLPIGKLKFKFTFFCPSLSEWNGNGFKYIHGDEIIDFVWECLNEVKKIETCSRRYDFGGWNDLEPYVRFFKERDVKPTLVKFEEYCNDKL